MNAPGDSILEVAPDAVHVWRCDLRRPLEDSRVLDEGEQERASRFVFDRDRRRYRVSHTAVRQILSRYLGVGPDALAFRTGPHGKPGVPGAALEFNLTHADDVCYVAVAGTPIGIDVETARHVDDVAGIAATVFAPVERDALASAPEECRTSMFLRGWTRKEAFLKTLGLGIGEELQKIVVGLTDEDRVVEAVPGVSTEPVYIRTVACESGEYVGVGSLKGFRRIECFRWQ